MSACKTSPNVKKRFAYIPLLQIREPKKAVFKLDHCSKHHLVTSELHPFEIYADHLWFRLTQPKMIVIWLLQAFRFHSFRNVSTYESSNLIWLDFRRTLTRLIWRPQKRIAAVNAWSMELYRNPGLRSMLKTWVCWQCHMVQYHCDDNFQKQAYYLKFDYVFFWYTKRYHTCFSTLLSGKMGV